MGILDDLKNTVEKLGDKAKEGLDDARDKAGDLLDDARDKAGDLVDDAKERFSGHDDERSPLSESTDVGPDTSSTDAVQPGYVTAEDDVDDPESGEDSLDDDSADSDGAADAEDATPATLAEDDSFVSEPAATSDVVPPAAAELDPVDLDAAETVAADPTDQADQADQSDQAVETDVDPYDQPLTESIGDELANALAAQQAESDTVGTDTGTDPDPKS